MSLIASLRSRITLSSKPVVAGCTAAFAAALALSAHADSRPPASDWPTLMGNNTRDSRSLLKSNMTTPSIAAKYYFGGYKGYAQVSTNKHTTHTKNKPLVFEGAYPYKSLSAVEDDYAFNGFIVPLLEKTVRKHMSQQNRYLSLYDGEMNYLDAREEVQNGKRIHFLMVYRVEPKSGHKQLLWEKELFYHERPHITVADMNGDGRKDIVFQGWSGISVIDRDSHEIIMSLSQNDGWHLARKRGHSILRDIDGDGFPDLIIISIYPWDVNVIKNDGKKLSVKWFKVYDNHIESAKKIISAPRRPLEDYNNDGVLDILFNVWNEKGDSQWHIKALNVLDGSEVFDIPNAYVQDSLDTDGDGTLEIFASTPSGIDVPKYSNLKIYKVGKTTPRVVFEKPNSAWEINIDSEYTETYALHGGTNEKPGFKQLVTGGDKKNKHFYISTKNEKTSVITRYTRKGRDGSFSIVSPHGVVVNLIKEDTDGNLLIEVQSKYSSPKGININGGAVKPLYWTPFNSKEITPVIAALGGGPKASVLLANTVDEIVRLDYSRGNFTQRWAKSGLGMGYQYDANTDFGVIADDFNGDGKKEIIVRVDDGAKGGGVKCIDSNGKTLWQTEFPLVPSGKIIGFKGNIAFFSSANVNNKKVVIVNAQRNVQHTGITSALDGKTGKVLWNLDVIRKGKPGESGAGANVISVFDLDGDGIDEVLNGFGNNLWAAKASTGEVLFANFMRGLWDNHFIKNNPHLWVQQILPIPIKTGNKQADLFLANAHTGVGLLHVNLGEHAPKGLENKTALLWGNEDTSWSIIENHCLADVNGDGRIEVVEVGIHHGSPKIHIYDPYTRKEIGDLIHQSGILIAADINNDGKDEILISSGSVLCAYGYNGVANVFEKLWEISFGASISRPVYGDVDGDGKGEIVVTDRNGFVYLIK